jgi:hypothetical protein
VTGLASGNDRDAHVAATTERPVKCRRYKHGGARFYTVDAKGVERLLADTYNAEATERVAGALGAEVEEA